MTAGALPPLAAVALAIGLALAIVPSASGAPSQLDGSCSFTGPIKPTPAITVIPRSGSRFSFNGSGHCDGHLDGAAITAAAITVTFNDVQTVFDTCELGPDVNLPGTLTIGGSHFDVIVDLARLVLVGPLRITTGGGGLGFGSAQFQPGDPSTAVQQCVGTGLDNATLAGSFTTLATLRGQTNAPAAVPQGTGSSGQPANPSPRVISRRAHRHRHVRHRPTHRRGRLAPHRERED